MTISVLDRVAETEASVIPSLGALHDAAVLAERTPCHEGDPELWFAESPADVEAAKALCGPCPVRAACLAGALARREPWGVWGGELFVKGAVIARKRPRGRPTKADAAAWAALAG